MSGINVWSHAPNTQMFFVDNSEWSSSPFKWKRWCNKKGALGLGLFVWFLHFWKRIPNFSNFLMMASLNDWRSFAHRWNFFFSFCYCSFFLLGNFLSAPWLIKTFERTETSRKKLEVNILLEMQTFDKRENFISTYISKSYLSWYWLYNFGFKIHT